MNNNQQVLTSKPVLVVSPMPFSEYGAMSRLISAAVIDAEFCNLLLNDPQTALIGGYNGEYFGLGEKELMIVTSIRAHSLADYAQQLTERLYGQPQLPH